MRMYKKERNIIKRIFLVVVCICLLCEIGSTCECLKTQPFLNNIVNKSRVVKVRVVNHGLLPKNDIQNSLTELRYPLQFRQGQFPLVPFEFETYTKLEVLENYLGGELIDTILFLNGNGGSCLGSFYRSEIGSEYIIRYQDDAFLEMQVEGIINKRLKIKDNNRIKLAHSTDCIHWYLEVVKDSIIGNIFKSDQAIELRKLNNQIGELSEGVINHRIRKIKKILEERISNERFVQKLKEIEYILHK